MIKLKRKMFWKMLNELSLGLKYDEFKIYYITATSLLAFILLRWAPFLQRDGNTQKVLLELLSLTKTKVCLCRRSVANFKLTFFFINQHFPFIRPLNCRIFIQGRSFKKSTRCDGRVVVVTGGNTGIGKEAAVELAKRWAQRWKRISSN